MEVKYGAATAPPAEDERNDYHPYMQESYSFISMMPAEKTFACGSNH